MQQGRSCGGASFSIKDIKGDEIGLNWISGWKRFKTHYTAKKSLFVNFTFYSGEHDVDRDDPKISEKLHWKRFLISFHLPLLTFIS